MKDTGDPLVDDYLKRLNRELSDQKLVGTLVVPGGLLPAFLIVSGALGGYSETCVETGTTGAEPVVVCTGGPSVAAQILWMAFFVLSVVGPFFTLAFLATRMKRPTAAGYQPSPGSA